MDLKKRLARLDRQTRKQDRQTAPDSGCQVNADVPGALAALGLERRENAGGNVWYVEHSDTLSPPETPLPDLRGLFTRDADRCPEITEILFLDTETTGLAGGTGTLVFQMGVSWWQSGALVTRQYFLPGPGDELAMLRALSDLAREFSFLVSFNGASFDLPLLRTRALLNRLPDPLRNLTSWDLLVPARRMWGNRLPDCRQQTLEQYVCGRARGDGDIDGAKIPQTWFDFLASGQPGQLGNVLTHNYRDMVGMAEIFLRVLEVGRVLALPDAPIWKLNQHDDRAWSWALGRVCERRAEPEAAAQWFGSAWAKPWGEVDDELSRRRFGRDAIRNLKRCRAWDLVEEMIGVGLEYHEADPWLNREAAILYEHRLPDLNRALAHAQLSGDSHRMNRLVRMLAKRVG